MCFGRNENGRADGQTLWAAGQSGLSDGRFGKRFHLSFCQWLYDGVLQQSNRNQYRTHRNHVCDCQVYGCLHGYRHGKNRGYHGKRGKGTVPSLAVVDVWPSGTRFLSHVPGGDSGLVLPSKGHLHVRHLYSVGLCFLHLHQHSLRFHGIGYFR